MHNKWQNIFSKLKAGYIFIPLKYQEENIMKKLLALIMALAMVVACFAGCAAKEQIE